MSEVKTISSLCFTEEQIRLLENAWKLNPSKTLDKAKACVQEFMDFVQYVPPVQTAIDYLIANNYNASAAINSYLDSDLSTIANSLGSSNEEDDKEKHEDEDDDDDEISEQKRFNAELSRLNGTAMETKSESFHERKRRSANDGDRGYPRSKLKRKHNQIQRSDEENNDDGESEESEDDDENDDEGDDDEENDEDKDSEDDEDDEEKDDEMTEEEKKEMEKFIDNSTHGKIFGVLDSDSDSDDNDDMQDEGDGKTNKEKDEVDSENEDPISETELEEMEIELVNSNSTQQPRLRQTARQKLGEKKLKQEAKAEKKQLEIITKKTNKMKKQKKQQKLEMARMTQREREFVTLEQEDSELICAINDARSLSGCLLFHNTFLKSLKQSQTKRKLQVGGDSTNFQLGEMICLNKSGKKNKQNNHSIIMAKSDTFVIPSPTTNNSFFTQEVSRASEIEHTNIKSIQSQSVVYDFIGPFELNLVFKYPIKCLLQGKIIETSVNEDKSTSGSAIGSGSGSVDVSANASASGIDNEKKTSESKGRTETNETNETSSEFVKRTNKELADAYEMQMGLSLCPTVEIKTDSNAPKFKTKLTPVQFLICKETIFSSATIDHLIDWKNVEMDRTGFLNDEYTIKGKKTSLLADQTNRLNYLIKMGHFPIADEILSFNEKDNSVRVRFHLTIAPYHSLRTIIGLDPKSRTEMKMVSKYRLPNILLDIIPKSLVDSGEHRALWQACKAFVSQQAQHLFTHGAKWTLGDLLKQSIRTSEFAKLYRKNTTPEQAKKKFKLNVLPNDYQIEAIHFMAQLEKTPYSCMECLYYPIQCIRTNSFVLYSPILQCFYIPALDGKAWIPHHSSTWYSDHPAYQARGATTLAPLTPLTTLEADNNPIVVPRKRFGTIRENQNIFNHSVIIGMTGTGRTGGNIRNLPNFDSNSNSNSQHHLMQNIMAYVNSPITQMADIRGGYITQAMGLGKTIEAIALINYCTATHDDLWTSEVSVSEKKNPPSSSGAEVIHPRVLKRKTVRRVINGRPVTKTTLLITPPQLLEQWIDEIDTKSAIELKVINLSAISGKKKIPSQEEIFETDVIVVTYSKLVNIIDFVKQFHWHRIILDEMTMLKKTTKKRMESLNELSYSRIELLSGTPLKASIIELETPMNMFKIPGLYNSQDNAMSLSSTGQTHCNNFWRCLKLLKTGLLTKSHYRTSLYSSAYVLAIFTIFRDMMIRHVKEQSYNGRKTLITLPPRREETIKVEMKTEEREMYEMFLKQAKQSISKYNQDKLCSPLEVCKCFEDLERSCSYTNVDVVQLQTSIESIAKRTDAAQMRLEAEEKKKNVDLGKMVEKVAKIVSFSTDDQKCGICLDEFKNPTQTKCRHVFCSMCIKDWFDFNKINTLCPECRAIIDKKTMTKPKFKKNGGGDEDTKSNAKGNKYGDDDDDDDDDDNGKKPRKRRKLKKTSSGKGKSKSGKRVRNKYDSEEEDEKDNTPSPSPSLSSTQQQQQQQRHKRIIILSKLIQLTNSIEKSHPADKFVVFTKFNDSVDAIEQDLKKRGIQSRKMTVGTPQTHGKNLKDFAQNVRVKVILLTYRSSAFGLNLTAGNRLVIFDTSRNISEELQAINRVYRIGQQRPVLIERYVFNSTVESPIIQLNKQNIRELADGSRMDDKDDHYEEMDFDAFLDDYSTTSSTSVSVSASTSTSTPTSTSTSTSTSLSTSLPKTTTINEKDTLGLALTKISDDAILTNHAANKKTTAKGKIEILRQILNKC